MVRRLHLDELGPGAGIAEDDWYETERLTGHITGRARSNPGLEQRLQDAPAVVLDWRHAREARPRTVLSKWRRAVASRRRPWQRPRFTLWISKLRRRARRGRPGAVGSAHSAASVTAAQTPQQAVSGHIADPTSAIPRLGLRHATEPAGRDTPRSFQAARAAKHRGWRWSSGAIAAALTIASAATGAVGIVSAVGGGAAKPGQTGVVAGASLRSSVLAPTDAALMRVLSGVALGVRRGSSPGHHVPPPARRRDAKRHSSHAPAARSAAGAGSVATHTTLAAPPAPTRSYTPVVASPHSSAGYRQSSTSGAVAPQHSAPSSSGSSSTSSSSSSSTSPSKSTLRSLINGPGQCSC